MSEVWLGLGNPGGESEAVSQVWEAVVVPA